MNQTRERFVTDSVGNRLTKEVNSQTVTYTYVTGTNKIQEITGPVAYTHDANGNITGIGSKVLTYNQNNRLIRVEEISMVLGEYTYNGEGQRIIKTAGGVTTVFHYDFNGNLIAESDENGSWNYEYLYKGGSRLALVDVASGEIYSFLNDRLGTPQMLADSTNTIVWEGIYEPFGEAEVNPNSSVVNNFRFPGQYYDQETGFHYNYHRYYDPNNGRYLTPDPIGLAGGINLFSYVLNNSVNKIDPLGLAEYIVNFVIKSYSWPNSKGTLVTVEGTVYTIEKNKNGKYEAVRFKGNFTGGSISINPFSKSFTTMKFKDNWLTPDVTRIQGYSSITDITFGFIEGGSLSRYKFGELINANPCTSTETTSILSLTPYLSGNIKLVGNVYETPFNFEDFVR
jgi:RHS repeat-associated protein